MTLTERVTRAYLDADGTGGDAMYTTQDGWRVPLWPFYRSGIKAAIREVLAAQRAYHPLSGWTGTPAAFLDAFEAEHLPGKRASTIVVRDETP